MNELTQIGPLLSTPQNTELWVTINKVWPCKHTHDKVLPSQRYTCTITLMWLHQLYSWPGMHISCIMQCLRHEVNMTQSHSLSEHKSRGHNFKALWGESFIQSPYCSHFSHQRQHSKWSQRKKLLSDEFCVLTEFPYILLCDRSYNIHGMLSGLH